MASYIVVGETLGAPVQSATDVICRDGIVQVPDSALADLVARGIVRETAAPAIGAGGVAFSLRRHEFDGPCSSLLGLAGLEAPPQTPPQNPPAEWRDCPYSGAILAHDAKILSRMLNAIGRKLGVDWK